MGKIFVLLAIAVASCSGYLYPIEPRGPLPGTPSPPGSPWPLPQAWVKSPILISVGGPGSLAYSFNVENCAPFLWFSQKFTYGYMFGGATRDPRFPALDSVVVELTSNETLCNANPKLGDDESYTLSISSNLTDATVRITAANAWGALRGLSTFTQLFFDDLENQEQDGLHFYANITQINDWPRFPHRGIMIDTARHYQPERVIHQIIDSMFFNKLNVLHWHIVDDQSFPYVSRKFPELSLKGAYNPRAIYTPQMISRTLEFARVRGIRVIFEFDSPGHTGSWGKAFRELLTPCYGDGENPGTPDHPHHTDYENLDPTRNTTYEFVRELFEEVGSVSPEEYIHLGMDEVYMPCWNSSPEIKQFMFDNGYERLSQVQEHFTTRVIQIVKDLGLKPIVWQDPLDADVVLDKDVIVQIWKDWQEGGWENDTQKALDKGHFVLLSAPWYLNYIGYGPSWKYYYEKDPILDLPDLKPGQEEQVLGGEACLWAEYIDKTNIVPRLFPFVGAVAERLWSEANSSTTDDAMWRLDQHRCRMLRRGIPAQPILNGYCGMWETELEE